MKRISILFLCSLVVWASCDKATESIPESQQPPKAVIETIADKFSGVTGLEITTLQDSTLYAADFYAQTKHYQAIIAQDGTMRMLEEERDTADLPRNGRSYVENQFINATDVSVYAQINPDNRALRGYSANFTAGGKHYLLTFDTIGARISTMEVPVAPWWRYEVQAYSEIPQNIRTRLEADHPQLELQAANMLVDVNQMVRWLVAVRKDNFLFNYQFDANGQILSSHSEDLLALDGPNMTFLELDVSSLPTIISDFLNARFTGWNYERGILLLQSNSPVGFTVKILLNQTVYYARFNLTGNFIGATKG
ncbi:MAG: hypothetical protein WCR52_17110 [Bacteroidota bacterium]